jgi:hypothetical protein
MDSTVLSEPMPEASTVIEPRGHNADPAQSAHKDPDAPEPKEEKPAGKESRLDTIKRAAADLEKQGAEPAKEAPKEEAKPEAEAKAPPVKEARETAPEAAKPVPPPEGKKTIAPPARFLPQARQLWANVPNPVKEEWTRIEKERETEISQYREAKEFRDEFREYEEMARAAGTTPKKVMDNYVAIERKFAEDPAQGLRQIMQNMGMHPKQALVHMMQAVGVNPQQLAAHMAQNPHEYTALAQQQQVQHPQPQMQKPQEDSYTKQLEQRIQEIEADLIHNSVIAPFAEEYPEYYQYEEQIAKVLESRIIEKIHGNGLSPRGKLEAALFMVSPNTARSTHSAVQESQTENAPAAVNLRADKSVKGAPTPGTDASGRKRGMSRTEAISAAAAELGVRL